ncbi:MAG: hypothetical protein K0V04_13410 [Deltaproteobacteria bacterium]|nr:hypothetical protein [Deltaproteobacteria bacterium]
MMAFMKRCQIELMALGVATAGVALFAGPTTRATGPNSPELTASQAGAEAASYLEHTPQSAQWDRDSQRWSVTDAHDTAWIDGQSGELVAIEFGEP